MSQSLDSLLAEYDELEKKLADPSVHSDQAGARKLGKRYAAAGADREDRP